MSALRDVIERRVNLFGVSEPIVQTQKSSILSGAQEERLIVELPGVTDTQQAIDLIGKTPVLEFKLVKRGFEGDIVLNDGGLNNDAFEATGLTGRYLKRAKLEFNTSHSGLPNEPIVVLEFNDEGSALFAKITREHVGEALAIFLDGSVISSPVIREEIPNGTATISGGFTPEEARDLVKNLNFGALPVPIELLSTQTIGASLGSEALVKGITAGASGMILVITFLIFWYRLPGVIAGVSLTLYILLMFAIFKLIPVTLTSAGIAGFILSIGMAVDANVLIFERMKEELKAGKKTREAAKEGFARAWLSIRDGNISSIISAIILFWFGTSLIEGFALTFGLGVVVSMLTAIIVSRTFIYALGNYQYRRFVRFLFGSGITY
jgi:protein-export membrane protein SecD